MRVCVADTLTLPAERRTSQPEGRTPAHAQGSEQNLRPRSAADARLKSSFEVIELFSTGWPLRGVFPRILLFISALAAFSSSAAAERRAFIVGINTYENIDPPLVKAHNDANSMASTFKELGFEVALKLDANQEELLSAWTQFLASIKREDIVAVFFAGHGVQISGLNYLLPRDIPPADKGEELLKARSLGLAKMMDDLADRKPRVNLMIIDACRNNPFKAADGKRSLGGGRGLASIEQPRGIFVIYSAGVNQTALDRLTEVDPDPNSVFTRRLLPLLKQPGLSLVQVAKQVQGEVAEDARTRYVWNGKKISHPQSPAYYDGIEGNFFISGDVDSAKAAWETIKGSSSIAILQAFITQYPGTAFAAQAQERITQIRSAEAKKQTAMHAEADAKLKAASEPKAAMPAEQPLLPTQTSIAEQKIAANTDAGSKSHLARPSVSPESIECSRQADTMKLSGVARKDFRKKCMNETSGATKAGSIVGMHPDQSVPLRPTRPGATFRDCSDCPEMVILPAGEFLMGSTNERDPYRADNEGPQHKVIIAKPFAAGRTHVTRGEYNAFVLATGRQTVGQCYDLGKEKWEETLSWHSPGFQQGNNHPVVCVNWVDANAYVTWLGSMTGQKYSLLSEAQSQYAARGTTVANAQSRFYFGNDEKGLCAHANGADETAKETFRKLNAAPCKDGYVYTAPARSFKPNAFGLFDVHGNVRSWTEDCWHDRYETNDAKAPLDGSAWTTACTERYRRVVYGGSWFSSPEMLRSAERGSFSFGERSNDVGFRVARAL